jgi:menaquinone-dependent protoporphyrinogen IX oxidase
MTTAIVYYSQHHGNTKKLLDAIKAADSSVELIDVNASTAADLSSYDRIGFAEAIASSISMGLLCLDRQNLSASTSSSLEELSL